MTRSFHVRYLSRLYVVPCGRHVSVNNTETCTRTGALPRLAFLLHRPCRGRRAQPAAPPRPPSLIDRPALSWRSAAARRCTMSTPPTTGGRTAARHRAYDARHRVYDATKMYGAKAAFASDSRSFVGGIAPIVLAAATTPISIELGNISGPLTLGAPAQVNSFGSFNPSRIAAPAGLCPRCVYIASLRVEALHQCLINVDGRIFATYVCHGCNFGLLLMHLTGEATADGGLRRLRAWRSQRFMSNVKWARGRNQAVFSARRSPDSPTEIFVQPWLSLIASFGVPRFFLLNVSCYKHPVFQWQQVHHCAPQHLYVYAQRKGLAPSD